MIVLSVVAWYRVMDGGVLSPTKLHPLLEEADPKKPQPGKLLFLDICSTHEPDGTKKIGFYAICCFFAVFVYQNKLLFGLIRRVCFTNVVVLVFQNPTSVCLFRSSFSKMTLCGSPVVPKFVLQNKLLFYVPQSARPRAPKVGKTIVYGRPQKKDTKCTTHKQ